MRSTTTVQLLLQQQEQQHQELEPLTSKERRRRRQLQQIKPFYHICSAADCTSAVGSSFVASQNFQLAKRCMQIVDADRLLWVLQQQSHYKVSMASLDPLDITPKNNVILGMPMQLSTANYDDNHPVAGCSPSLDALVALAASASENASAEAGERQKTGSLGFGTRVTEC